MSKKSLVILTFFLVAYSSFAQFYYGLNQEFGKNRVQYQSFYWKYFGYNRFQVYMYEGGLELSKFVAYHTEKELERIEKKLDYQFEDKLQILVFTNQGDYRQSNLGISNEEGGNLGGVTKISGTKLCVYFKGNHFDLIKQIRSGIAEVLINELMYGGRTRDMVKNSTLLVLPDWYKKGLIAYLSEEWNVELDNIITDGIKNDRYYSFNKLSEEESLIAGHSLWNYISETYGESSIPNLLYMTKVSRSVETSFSFVLGNNIQSLIYEWIDYYAKNLLVMDTTRYLPNSKPIITKPKKNRKYYQLKISNDGEQVAYVTNELSQYKVFIKNTSKNSKPKRIAKWGPKIERINDYSYPLLAWNPRGNVLGMIHEKKGVVYISTYNVDDDELFTKPIIGFEKIIDFAYSPDGRKITFSGIKKGKGQVDIFVYSVTAGSIEQITNDVWDDNFPRFVNKGNQLLFTSNRISDTIKESDDAKYDLKQSGFHDVFMYDINKKNRILMRVTNTPYINESQPSDYEDGYFTYLTETNGIRNRCLAKLDSVIAYVDTTEHYRFTFSPKIISNFKNSILEQDLSLNSKKIAEVFFHKGKNYFYVTPFSPADKEKNFELQNTNYRNFTLTSPRYKFLYEGNQNIKNTFNKTQSDSLTKNPPIINNQPFKEEKKDTTSIGLRKEFKLPQQRNYYVNFSLDNVVTQLDNSFLNQTYQRFTGSYLNPGFNAFTKIGMSDLFEDYRIIGGARLTTGLNTEMFISIENRKKLVDKQLILHRQSFYNIENASTLMKMNIHDVQFKVKYPFSEVLALKGSIIYRNDRKVYTSLDDYTLQRKNDYDNYAGAKTELVFDNTKTLALNILRGNRSKLFAEYWKRIDINNLSKRNDLVVLGFDFRNYTRIHRNFIWANRLAGSTSFGTDRLIYYLGGVDNWFAPKYDYNINILHPETYQFQTIATNMRGFKQNARNGNNFVVYNSELRLPFFNYLLNRPIRSDFFNNFQVVGFFDLGMAWYGKNPYSDENTENKTYVPGNPITVVLIQNKEPLIAGYGFGFRSRLFGYFFRLDFSRGIDNRVKQEKINYLSFTTDF